MCVQSLGQEDPLEEGTVTHSSTLGWRNPRTEGPGKLPSMGYNVKRPDIRIIGVPEEEDKKKSHEKLFEEIIAENFPKLGKEIATQVHETQRVPNRINPRRNTPRHIF